MLHQCKLAPSMQNGRLYGPKSLLTACYTVIDDSHRHSDFRLGIIWKNNGLSSRV